MRRRRVLAATGAALTGLAGCLGGTSGDDPTTSRTTTTSTATSTATTTETATATTTRAPGPLHGDDLPADPDPTDGYPPEFDEQPAASSADPSTFETIEVEGETVSLAPIDAVYSWYGHGEARFVDARGPGQYRASHVFGAVSSPISDVADDPDDPVDDWPAEDRIVCYCGCPHHLSSIRASELQKQGFGNVFVIDEGYWEWYDRDYPMAGDEVGDAPALVEVDGVVAQRYAGEYALASHAASGQVEAAPIGADGRFRLEIRFSGVDDSTPVTVETPAFRVEGPLGDLSAGVLTGGS